SRLVTQVVLMGALGAILYLPVLVPVLRELLFADYSLKGWGDAQKLSVDLLGFISPSALSPWSGLDWNRELTSVAQGNGRFSDINTVFVGYVTLAVAAVGALAFLRQARLWIAVAIALLGTLLVLEHLSVPLPLTDATVPAFYSQLADDTDDYAILQLPLGWRNSFGTLGAEDTRVQYYQSIHHKRMLGGNTSRNP